jgi:hypothetical protein
MGSGNDNSSSITGKKKYRHSINRRGLIRTLGATGGGVMLGIGATDRTFANQEGTEELIQSEAVNRVIERVEQPHPETGTIVQVEPDIEAAEFKSEESDLGDTKIKSASVPTNLGEIVVAEFDGAHHQSTFLLDDEIAGSYQDDRNAAIENSDLSPTLAWPHRTTAYVTNYEDGPRFNRTVTNREMASLSRAVSDNGATPEDLSPSMVQNERDGIRVLADGAIEKYVISYPKPDELHEVHVDPESETTETKSLQFGQVGVQSSVAECSTHAYGCARNFIFPNICGYCRSVCALRMKLPGYAACFVCVSHICGLSIISHSSCASAIHCLGQLGYQTP